MAGEENAPTSSKPASKKTVVEVGMCQWHYAGQLRITAARNLYEFAESDSVNQVHTTGVVFGMLAWQDALEKLVRWLRVTDLADGGAVAVTEMNLQFAWRLMADEQVDVMVQMTDFDEAKQEITLEVELRLAKPATHKLYSKAIIKGKPVKLNADKVAER